MQFLALTGGWFALRNSPWGANADPAAFESSGGGGNGRNSSSNGRSGDGGGSEGSNHSQASLIGSRNEEETEARSEMHLDSSDAEVSIIIPALNEAACIATTIGQFFLSDPPPARVIVVDGGSEDGTQEKARKGGAVVVEGERGRARQQNRGAKVAAQMAGHDRGILCFVHADTVVPTDLVSESAGLFQTRRSCQV
jgi:cellulose synthase/poly-beta-1,6-N-acetylglucosamine synthase-like glycosyltransferase